MILPEFSGTQKPTTDHTNVVLLQKTQAFLRFQLTRHAPDSVLVAAWDEFYRIYNGLIRRFVVVQGLRGADVDDCVQEVWATVAVRLVDFRRPIGRRGLRAWLYTVVRSRVTDLVRRRSRRPEQTFVTEDVPRADTHHSGIHSTIEDGKDWRDALVKTLLAELRTQVSDVNFRVLKMRMLENRSVAEVADVLDLTPAQVRYRHCRTLRRLRALSMIYTGQCFERDFS